MEMWEKHQGQNVHVLFSPLSCPNQSEICWSETLANYNGRLGQVAACEGEESGVETLLRKWILGEKSGS